MHKTYYSLISKSNIALSLLSIIIAVCSLLIGDKIYAATITYTYDSLNRLASVDYGNGANITYTYDEAGNRLTMVSTPPPDSTPPTTPVIIDDGVYTLDLSQLHALWNADDPESGLAECQYAIGTTPQGSEVVGWTTFFCSNNSLTHSGLNLLDGVTYYISLKVRNSALLWSEIGSSDGIMALSPDSDADGDGLTNDDEVNIHGTDPLDSDDDNDGMPDGWEVANGLSPTNDADALKDADNDEFTNLKEYQTGTDPNDPNSHPSLAIAGSDQNVRTGSSVTLDGSESSGRDGNLITFNWIETNKPLDSTATLSNPNVPKPSFIADKDGYYSYDLTVCDSLYCSGPDSVAVNATTLNVPPNANAGHDQYVLTGQPVLLDGSKSNDADTESGLLIYLWSFMSVPPGSLLTDADITNRETLLASFTPDIDGEYRLDLSVKDGSATSHDQISVTAGTTTPPVANAGLDQIVQLEQSVILDGSGSYDQDGLPQPITHQWSIVSIPTGSSFTNSDIINSDTVSANFTPDIAGIYVLGLAVSDGLYTASDNVVVEVDGVSPNGSILINNGAVWTNKAAVTLTLGCTDSESGCMDMRLSNDNINFTDWEPFITNRSWTLSSGDGEKQVYVQYRDGAGNPSESFSNSINLDTTKPVVKGVSDSPDPFKHHLGEKTTISFILSDNLSGACLVQAKIYNSANKLVRTIKKNGASCPAGGAASSVKWDGKNSKGVLVPAGTYTYKIQARDSATNKSAIKQGTVTAE